MNGVSWMAVVIIAGTACGRMAFDSIPAANDGDIDGPEAVPSDLVLWLPMDTPVANAMTIDAARGHPVGCMATGCPSSVTGVRRDAYELSGARDAYFQTPDTPDLDPTGGFTVALWVNLVAYNSEEYSCFISKPVALRDSYLLGIHTASGTVLYETGTSTTIEGYMGPVLPIGEWHHLALAWNAATTIRRSFLDGILLDTRSVMVETDAHPILIGADDNNEVTLVYQTRARLDDVRVYSRALDDAEIAALAK